MEPGMMGTSRSTNLLLFTVSGTAGITALFLPFAEGIHPFVKDISFIAIVFGLGPYVFNSLASVLLALATPFLLVILVSVSFVRWMIFGLLSRPERAIAYVVSSMMAFATLYVIIRMLLEILSESSANVDFWLIKAIALFTIPLLTLLFGVYVVIKNLRNKGSKEVSAVIAMQIAYLGNALFCLMFFVGDWQVGAYIVVVTSIVYVLQIVLTSMKVGVFRGGGMNSSE
jgi:hypothetical protein